MADQSSAANLSYASNFGKSKIYKGKSVVNFLAGRQKLTVAARTLVVFLKYRNGHTLKVRKLFRAFKKHELGVWIQTPAVGNRVNL
jgi:hypothetical protein